MLFEEVGNCCETFNASEELAELVVLLVLGLLLTRPFEGGAVVSNSHKICILSCHPEVFKFSLAMRITQLQLQPLNKYTIVMIPSVITRNIAEIMKKLDQLKLDNKTPPSPMITLLWNCRGMNKPNFFLAFKDLIDHHKPYIVILTETKLTKDKLPPFLPKLGFPNYDMVEAEGNSGGILVLWTVELNMEILGLTFQELHLKVKVNTGLSFLLTAVYAKSCVC